MSAVSRQPEWHNQAWLRVLIRTKEPLASWGEVLNTHFDQTLSEDQKIDQQISTGIEWIRNHCPASNLAFRAQTKPAQVKELMQKAMEAIAQQASINEYNSPIYRTVRLIGMANKMYFPGTGLTTKENEDAFVEIEMPDNEPTEFKIIRLQGELLQTWSKNPALFWTQGGKSSEARQEEQKDSGLP